MKNRNNQIQYFLFIVDGEKRETSGCRLSFQRVPLQLDRDKVIMGQSKPRCLLSLDS